MATLVAGAALSSTANSKDLNKTGSNPQRQTSSGEVYTAINETLSDSLQRLKEGAESGNTDAQWQYGVALIRGYAGRTPNKPEGARWIRLAASAGNPIAQTALGHLYLIGEGVPLDYQEAHTWTSRAALQGHVPAQTRLASMFRDGIGTETNRAEQLKWLEEAARQGDSESQYLAAMQLLLGDGVQKDIRKAIHWLNLATTQGNANAQATLASLYFKGAEVPANRGEALRLAELSAAQNNAMGMQTLAIILLTDKDKEPDIDRAKSLLRRSAILLREDPEALIDKVMRITGHRR